MLTPQELLRIRCQGNGKASDPSLTYGKPAGCYRESGGMKRAALLPALIALMAGMVPGAITGDRDIVMSVAEKDAVVGQSLAATVGLPAIEGEVTLYIFLGTAKGQTPVQLAGQTVTLPLAGSVSVAAGVKHTGTLWKGSFTIPDNQSLVGEDAYVVPVLVTGSGRVMIASASVPIGPIIEDALA